MFVYNGISRNYIYIACIRSTGKNFRQIIEIQLITCNKLIKIKLNLAALMLRERNIFKNVSVQLVKHFIIGQKE